MEEQIHIEEKKWVRIVNAIVGWFGIALMAALLGTTAGVDLYRNHFRLFVITICLLPVVLGIERLVNLWVKKAAAERLRAEAAESESVSESVSESLSVLQEFPAVRYAASASRNFGAVQARFRRKRIKHTGFELTAKNKRI